MPDPGNQRTGFSLPQNTFGGGQSNEIGNQFTGSVPKPAITGQDNYGYSHVTPVESVSGDPMRDSRNYMSAFLPDTLGALGYGPGIVGVGGTFGHGGSVT